MSNKEKKTEGDSFIGYIITEIIINGIVRFFGWVIAGVAGLFIGD